MAVPPGPFPPKPVAPKPIPILLYHGVAPSAPDALRPWVIEPDRFAAHLDLLVAGGWSTLTISQLVAAMSVGEDLPERTVAITFDDGLADFVEHAWPALVARGLTATHYVVSGHIGGTADWLAPLGATPPMMSWDDLRMLDAAGCEIGGHTLSHPELDTLPTRELNDEVAHCRRRLSSELGRPVRSFAYPHGYHDRRTKAAVRAAGYSSACAVREAMSSRGDDAFALARVTITHDVTVSDLAAVLDGRGLRTAPFPETVKTKAWRAVRRYGGRTVVDRALGSQVLV